MTSVTSPQQTDRRGTDEIPAPRGGQGVRLLVLGADPDAQELRDQAAAAGYELAQRYSARVSHVAYGTGVDPEDSRYTKIRDAGLVLLPLQKCAEELGLSADGQVEMVQAETGIESLSQDVADVADEPDVPDVPDSEPLAIPPLHPVAEEAPKAEAKAESASADGESAAAFVPGFSDEVTELPLAAAVIGADPWTGTGTAEEADDADEDAVEVLEVPVVEAAPAPPKRSNAGHVLLSVVWALIPFATFGLLTPITFGYAAYRLRSRTLVLTAIAYTLAVIASFVLSAARPHSATPSDTAGALLTLALAGTWIGGTLHAVSIRTRVFAR